MNGQSRRLHALETWWSDSCPNGVAERPWDLLRVPAPAASARRGPRRPRLGRAPRRHVPGSRCCRSGRTARPAVSSIGGARPIPTVLRARHLLARRVSERRGQRPPWDLLRVPTLAASARRAPRRPRPASAFRLPVVRGGGPTARPTVSLTRGGWSFPGALCAVHPPPPAHHRAGWLGPAAGLPRGRPAALNGRRAGRRDGWAIFPGAFFWKWRFLSYNPLYPIIGIFTFSIQNTGNTPLCPGFCQARKPRFLTEPLWIAPEMKCSRVAEL